MITTTLTGLTTIFTPPSTCSSSWTYEAEVFNSIPGGLLLQNALPDFLDTECFPSGFEYAGRAPDTIDVFSPGACPVGYTIATESFESGTTLAVCCENNFVYSSTFSLKDQFNSTTILFAGCISTFTGDSTTVVARSGLDDSGLNTTVITGAFSMWGQPISVEFQRHDLTLYTTSSSIHSSTSVSTSMQQTAQPSSAITQPSPNPTAPVPSSSPIQTSSLSTGAKAGVAVAAVIAGFLIVAAFIIFFRRRRRATKEQQPFVQPWERREIDGSEIRYPVEMAAQPKTVYVNELE